MAEGGAGYTGMSDGGSAGGGMQGGMGGMSQMPSGGGGGGEGGMDMGKMQSMASDMMDKPAQNVEGINDMINAGKNAQRGAKFLMAEHLASTNGNRWGFPS